MDKASSSGKRIIMHRHGKDGELHSHEYYEAEEHPGHRVIAVCGKGGVGKTAFSAMMTHALLHRPDVGKLLVIDADPAFGLQLALGIESAPTIASVRDEIFDAANSKSIDVEREMAGKIDYLVMKSLVEMDGYAFLAMGRSKELGCFCSINDLLRDSLELLVRDFDTILIDCEAGLEQINRQVVASLDCLVAVTDGSARGMRTVETFWDIAGESEIVPQDRIYLVLNRQSDECQAAPLRSDVTPHYIGSISEDSEVAEFDRSGRPLFELGHENAAQHAVSGICGQLFEHMAGR